MVNVGDWWHRFESVTVQIDPDKNDLYDIESNHYGLPCIQYQRNVVNWLLREYGNVEVQYETLDIRIGEERYAHGHLRDLQESNRDIACIYHDNAWYLLQLAEYSYECKIGCRNMLHSFQINE